MGTKSDDMDGFAEQVETAITELPPEFRGAVENVAILVEEEADPETSREMELGHPLELLGLYRGLPLPERGSHYAGAEPDQVFLYRRAILLYSRDHGLEVADCVRNTLIHELGHYLGYDDDDLHRIEYGEPPEGGPD
ncbi:metallopeptidase family protein [Thiohalorhabdus denitrificans]|uniref:Predicted Zn-dependent protease, minimal metalloprotease (MMP)-like domain n=1 Tax=Thiohalorhabdus denitrificans TaxID=381306 RepID=A0A1G5HBJ4_9GAMM|nr:metallopeptidase family protein [Thiohalorhabdus denitrificans]SCY61252.1 Predicted Zn-dependent protease, minimal metalloprotease (MMP)-like domain [Thiohalorhabdus denitrificans]